MIGGGGDPPLAPPEEGDRRTGWLDARFRFVIKNLKYSRVLAHP